VSNMQNQEMTSSREATPLNESELQSVVNLALEQAASAGADQAEASASIGDGLSISVRMGELETIEHTRDRGLVVNVYYGKRSGSASTSDYSAAAVIDAVKSACSIASFTEEDSASGLADQQDLATEFPDLDLYHPELIDVDEEIQRALACESSARQFDSRINNSEGASISIDRGADYFATSHGFAGSSRRTRYGISCAVIGQTDQGMQRDYWYDSVRKRSDLASAEEVGLAAARRTIRRLDGRKLKTGKMPVIFEAPVASSLISHFIGAISGGALYRKSSFLLDQKGQQVFPEFMRIHEQPLLKSAMGSSAYDNEGVATANRDIVQDGVLQDYVLSSYSARRLGLHTTGNAGGVHNLSVESGNLDLPGLLGSMSSGLLVTELVGHGVNPVTGDYSRGAAGFWVENGEIQYPVEEITIAGNLKDMFLQIEAIGSDIDTRGNTRCGSILLADMTIAGE
jgi:PmbA protein